MFPIDTLLSTDIRSGELSAGMGGGLAVLSGDILLSTNQPVTATGNRAEASAGAPLDLQLKIPGVSSLDVTGPVSIAAGGAFASPLGGVTVSSDTSVNISRNTASADGGLVIAGGGGVYSHNDTSVWGRNGVDMKDNTAAAHGGTPLHLSLDLDAATSSTFTGIVNIDSSIAIAGGGAAASFTAADISSDAGVNLSGNTASASGGIAAALGGGTFSSGASIKGVSNIVLENNRADARGGKLLQASVDHLDGAFSADQVALEGTVAAAAGGAVAATADGVVISGDAGVSLSGNTASASGGIAAALGGGIASIGGVSIEGVTGVSMMNNTASATASGDVKLTVSELKLDGVFGSNVPEMKVKDGTVRLPAAVAMGGAGASAGGVAVSSDSSKIELSGNSAQASGGIAGAIGGGFATAGGLSIDSQGDAAIRNNSATAQASDFELLSLNDVSMVIDLDGSPASDDQYSLKADSLSVHASVGLAMGGAGASAGGIAVSSDSGKIELSGNSAQASGGIAGAAGGGFAAADSLSMVSQGDAAITNNSAMAQAAHFTLLSLDHVSVSQDYADSLGDMNAPGAAHIDKSKFDMTLESVNLQASLGAALGGAGASIGDIAVSSDSGSLELSGNSAQASGGIAAAAGGGFATAGKLSMNAEGDAAITNNSATAAANAEGISLNVNKLFVNRSVDHTSKDDSGKIESSGTKFALSADSATAGISAGVALGGAGAAIEDINVESGSGALELSGNSAQASGGIAGAIGGGFATAGKLNVASSGDAVITDNTAAAEAENFALLTVNGVSVNYVQSSSQTVSGSTSEDSDEFSLSIDSAELQLSVGAALGGAGAAIEDINVESYSGALELSGNSAQASGGIAGAAGGGFATAGELNVVSSGDAVVTDNSATAAANAEGISLNVSGLSLAATGISAGSLALKAPVAVALGGAGASIGDIAVSSDSGAIELSGNSAQASGGIAGAAGGGFATVGELKMTGVGDAAITGNSALAKASNFELLSLKDVAVAYDTDDDPATSADQFNIKVNSLSLQASVAAALGGAGVSVSGITVSSDGGGIELSNNTAQASGSIAGAAGGGLAANSISLLAAKDIALKDNHATALTDSGALSLNLEGVSVSVPGSSGTAQTAGVDKLKLSAPVAAVLGGAGVSVNGITVSSDGGGIELSNNTAQASGGIAAALGGGLAAFNGTVKLCAANDVLWRTTQPRQRLPAALRWTLRDSGLTCPTYFQRPSPSPA